MSPLETLPKADKNLPSSINFCINAMPWFQKLLKFLNICNAFMVLKIYKQAPGNRVFSVVQVKGLESLEEVITTPDQEGSGCFLWRYWKNQGSGGSPLMHRELCVQRRGVLNRDVLGIMSREMWGVHCVSSDIWDDVSGHKVTQGITCFEPLTSAAAAQCVLHMTIHYTMLYQKIGINKNFWEVM